MTGQPRVERRTVSASAWGRSRRPATPSLLVDPAQFMQLLGALSILRERRPRSTNSARWTCSLAACTCASAASSCGQARCALRTLVERVQGRGRAPRRSPPPMPRGVARGDGSGGGRRIGTLRNARLLPGQLRPAIACPEQRPASPSRPTTTLAPWPPTSSPATLTVSQVAHATGMSAKAIRSRLDRGSLRCGAEARRRRERRRAPARGSPRGRRRRGPRPATTAPPRGRDAGARGRARPRCRDRAYASPGSRPSGSSSPATAGMCCQQGDRRTARAPCASGRARTHATLRGARASALNQPPRQYRERGGLWC
jgi:hypothetical protein